MTNGRQTRGFIVAVVLMHTDRYLRIDFGQCVDHLRQHDVVGIGTRAARCLNDHRRIASLGRLHDRKTLLHVVDIERRYAVAMLCRMIEKLAKGDAGHGQSFQMASRRAVSATASGVMPKCL